MNNRTTDYHRARRDSHPLNDATVTLKAGARAKGLHQTSPYYTEGAELLVLAVIGDQVFLAGPHGLASAPVSDVVRV